MASRNATSHGMRSAGWLAERRELRALLGRMCADDRMTLQSGDGGECLQVCIPER